MVEQTDIQAGGQLAGQVLFYGRPEPLTAQLHGALGVNRTDTPFAFVGQTHLIPLTVTEFAPASLSYPIIFVGDQKTPLAVMGLRTGENLFVSPKGELRPDAYVPAFARRYPFVFANDDANQTMILCVDRDAPIVSENADVPFFTNGEPSEYTKNALQFCNDFETERRRTESFVQLLQDLDLFSIRESVYRPQGADGTPGQPQRIAEFWAVDEEKLNKLPAEKLVELRDNGALAQIYCHIVSLLGWDKLIAMSVIRQLEQPAAANA